MQRSAKQKECRGNIFDERKPSGAQHRNVALHSQSLAITATYYLEPLVCISKTANQKGIEYAVIEIMEVYGFFFLFFVFKKLPYVI